MHTFFWNMTISYLLLFLLLSTVLYFNTKSKIFKYYAFYNLGVVIYLFLKDGDIFRWTEEHFLTLFFSEKTSLSLISHFNWLIQIYFYSFYFLFALYFLDLALFLPKTVNRLKVFFMATAIGFTALAGLSVYLDWYPYFFYAFSFLFIPVLLILSVCFFIPAIRFSGKQKYFFLVGVFSYILCALLAFYLTFTRSTAIEPLLFFYFGIIVENFCFSIGLGYKVKLLNDDRIQEKNKALQAEHSLELAQLQYLIEGEENERNRIAQDLHDGINGDLSAIKFQLMALEKNDSPAKVSKEIPRAILMIDQTCEQVRTISHNLSSTSVSNYGLSATLNQFCRKMSDDDLQIYYQWFGQSCQFSAQVDTTIYRIVQELITNIRKHAQASEAWLQCNNQSNCLTITVEDNGKGFDIDKNESGIGLQNIQNRLKFLKAKSEIESSDNGSCYIITIPITNYP